MERKLVNSERIPNVFTIAMYKKSGKANLLLQIFLKKKKKTIFISEFAVSKMCVKITLIIK